ncbi:2OG-Fe(II) oxygenase superfamily (plasmid) [Legionella adelaidensis]|uniref:2OG-Fe(II) oxygenase superfamily n=1 Tax=Legionella adelaidensis TaxID=45056 RepID=A0A0W0R0W4_9GAMM|nr:alpha-ketoglutarate-dependent dioxygenase AlkB [Legionella adelaidensis]KTC64706.1 2OG-Fe(II) oxygenase superfamily protein [Legionella adelaidensis]VEH86180.1 2OG-Fe(II) oxygenase superfamily [Legionella adelaidensis]
MEINNLPKGFFYIPDFIDESQAIYLRDHILQLTWQEITMYGQTARRRVVHFGLDYAYENRTVHLTTPPPPFLTPLIQKSAEALQVDEKEIAEILITQYPVGAGISWHRDAPVFDKILGLSLVSGCPLKLRIPSNKEVIKVHLAPRSAYILSDEARIKWQHAISPVKNERYSITLRTLKKPISR